MIRKVIGLVCIFLNVSLFGAAPKVREGFVQFLPEAQLKPFRDSLPAVDNPALQAILNSPNTMWYDDTAMISVYQDSITPITGVRANSIGRDIAVEGENVFNEKKQFHFPFSITAGLDKCDRFKILTFWAPPRPNGKALPVAWWNDDTGRYRWVFPKDTLFGEALFLKAPDGSYHPFEIRTRQRYADGWAVAAYRPFPTAKSLADAIQAKRPNWQNVPALKSAVSALMDNGTLVSARLESEHYGAMFSPIEGAIDNLPDLGDEALVKDLLRTAVYRSVEGIAWKRNARLETYAASTEAAFHIVPKGYEAGLFPVNEVSCNRCHEDTGRQFGEISFNSLLYGEVWGEDRIFTWHLFEQNDTIFAPYDQNRKLNDTLVNARLVESYQPSQHPDSLYKALPRRFTIHWY